MSDAGEDRDARRSSRWSVASPRWRIAEIIVLVVVPLAVFVGLYFFGPEMDEEEPVPAPVFARDVGGDDALELRSIRQEIEAKPDDVDGALERLGEFVLRCQDAGLARRAAAWRGAIEDAGEARDYDIRLRRYRLSQAAYERALHPLFEPGEPDIYLRVWRRREGKEELVYDGEEAAHEGWSGEWGEGAEGGVSFAFGWKVGEAVRVELREADLLGDNLVAEYSVEQGLGILLLSGPRISPNGHVVEFESDFAFGR